MIDHYEAMQNQNAAKKTMNANGAMINSACRHKCNVLAVTLINPADPGGLPLIIYKTVCRVRTELACSYNQTLGFLAQAQDGVEPWISPVIDRSVQVQDDKGQEGLPRRSGVLTIPRKNRWGV
jgi:hypothetical protein